jgi:hypothetical protein
MFYSYAIRTRGGKEMAICSKCGQVMVRLEDGTLDCGCFQESSPDYPGLDQTPDNEEEG